MPSPSKNSVWLTILVVEVTFMVLTRVILAWLPGYPVGAELLRTALRLTAVLAYLKLMPELISFKSNSSAVASPWRPALLAAISLFLIAPLLVASWGPAPPALRLIFALTSIPVALKEEVTFRALIQNLLVKRFGTSLAVVLTTTLFVLSHAGVTLPNFANYVQIALAGLFLGVMYARTQNLRLVIVLHAAYDALACLPSMFAMQGKLETGLLLLSMGLVLASATPTKHLFGRGL